MNSLCVGEGILAVPITAKRYDLGDKLGFLKANIEFGLRDEHIGPTLRSYLHGLTTSSSV
jgi:UTP--glucose-1-phosphate uridylyltransferase